MHNGRPLSQKKKLQLLLGTTILAWATQTLLHQWGYGAEIAPPAAAAPSDAVDATWDPAAMKFVPAPRASVGGTMELRAESTVYGAEIRLKQVCRWSERDKEMFLPVAETVVARFDPNEPFRPLGMEELKSTLRDAGVNLAQVRFSGPTRCVITRSDAARPGNSDDALQKWIDARQGVKGPQKPTSPVALVEVPEAIPASAKTTTRPAAPTVSVTPSGNVRSLREILSEDLSVRLAVPIEQLQIAFNPKDERLLNLSEPQFRFNLTPVHIRGLGEVAWEVLLVTDAGSQKAALVGTARAWQNQVVVNRPLATKQVIRADDVAEKRLLIDHLPEDMPLTLDQVLNQQASRDLKPGMVLTGRLVEAVPLARAGQSITITLNRGGIRVKTVGTAMEGGAFGQTIRVKNEATNDIYQVVLTAPQEGTIGPVAGGSPDAARNTNAVAVRP